ncbi:MAG: DUF222 domain-containing protein, partial [Acidimicrobiales bacterium]|nr:DUF222 domain-containing protein [Acidimicrobiales bacterium]
MVPPRDSDPNSAGLSGLTRGEAHLAAAEAIESRVAEVVGVVHGGHGALVGLAAEALEGRLWEGFGIHSPAQWPAWKSGLSIRVARQLVRVARRRTELPVAVGALEAGELSLDQIHLIAAHVPAAYDEAATELARVTTVAQLERVLPRYAWDDGPASAAEGDASSGDRDGDVSDDSPDDDPDERGSGPGSEGDAEASPLAGDAGSGDDVGTAPGGYRCGGVDGGSGWEECRRGGWWFTEDGFGRLSASLPPDEAMLVDAALKAARADLLSDWRAESGGDGPAPWFNEADALMHIVRAYLAHGRAGGASTDRFLVHAHLEQHPDGTPVMRSHLGPVLPDVLRRYLSCDCDVRPVWEVHGVPLSAGRSQ